MMRITPLQFMEILLELCVSGLNGVQAIRSLKNQEQTREMATEIFEQMEEGNSFSNSLMTVMINHGNRNIAQELLYLRTTEETGKVEPALSHICQRIRRKQDFKEEVGALLVYPGWIISMATIATILLIVYGIPHYQQLLPLAEKVIWRGIWYGVLWLLSVGCLGLGGAVWLVRRYIHQENLFTNLEYLCSEGVNLYKALSICEEITLSSKLRRTLKHIQEALEAGMDLAAAAQLYGMLDTFSTTWLAAADKGGRPTAAFCKIAEHYRVMEVRNMHLVQRMVEPWATITAGGWVLILAMSCALPLLTGIQI